MNSHSFLFSVFFMCTLFVSIQKLEAGMVDSSHLGIIPAPNKIQFKGKKSALKNITIALRPEMNLGFYNALFDGVHGVSLVQNGSANVYLQDDKALEKEFYRLDIQNGKIEIHASSNTGFQYAFTTLIQMVRHHGFPLPHIVIEDGPKFGYRGMHLDVARHFFSVEEVKKYLDYMAYYKFNHFHWHLTDDQGWRIAIKKFPKLQEVAAFRKETLIGHYNDQPHRFDGQKYGGYYSHEDINDIVTYANARNIQVVPEIEMPGHALAALAAYPELACENKKYEVATKWGVFEDVFCPGEKTFSFLQGVIDEVIALFPGKYIHIGGDECPKEAWKKSDDCQALIQSENLKDEHGLQSHFIRKMEEYIRSKGRNIIGWDEILEGGLAPHATVMSWRGVEGGLAAANQDHDVIMTPTSHCYFDHYQSESSDEPLAIGGLTTLEKVYHWEVYPDLLPMEKRKYILGGQSNLWSEYIKTYSGVEYMVYTRGMAMSEALWSKKKNYSAFLIRYVDHYNYWKSKGTYMAFNIYDLKPNITAGTGNAVQLSFKVPPGVEVQYAVDNLRLQKMDVSTPLKLEKSASYTFTSSKNGIKGRPTTLMFDMHKGTFATISLQHAAALQYQGNGPSSIVNGVKGSNVKYGGSEWLGFQGVDAIGVLDFGNQTEFNDVTFRFFKGEGQWIYLPKNLEVLASSDGENYTSIQYIDTIFTASLVVEVKLDLNKTKARYLKFVATNYGLISEGNQGAGHRAWLFLDEVVVR